jgi:hypothetical protein
MARAVPSVLAPWQATQHLFSNVAITIDGDHATTNHYLQATHVPEANNASEHADIGGWYDTQPFPMLPPLAGVSRKVRIELIVVARSA